MQLFSHSRSGTDTGAVNPLQLLGLVKSASGALFAQAALHAELAQVEWQEEKERLSKIIAYVLMAFACFLCLIFFLGLFAIALSWDTEYRIHVFVGLILSYVIALVWAGLRIRALAALGAKSFAATRAEIAADLELIKSAL